MRLAAIEETLDQANAALKDDAKAGLEKTVAFLEQQRHEIARNLTGVS